VNVAQRVQAILSDPETAWSKIEIESTDAAYLLTRYVAVLALIPPVAAFIGACVIGVVVPGVGTARLPLITGLFGAVFGYVISGVAVLIVALAAHLLAPSFGGRRDFERASKLVVYSYTPLWLAGIFLLAPGVRFLLFTGCYGAYILWLGSPVLMKTPKAKTWPYVAAIFACACAVTLIIVAAQRALFGLP